MTRNWPKVGECRVERVRVCGVEKPPAPNEQLLTTTVPEGDPKVGVTLTTIVGAAHEKQAEEAIALPLIDRRDADLELVLAAGRQRVAGFIHQVFGVLIHYEVVVLGWFALDNRDNSARRGSGCVVAAVVGDAVASSSGERRASTPATTINATTAAAIIQVRQERGIVRQP
jgi:hypothetical protein